MKKFFIIASMLVASFGAIHAQAVVYDGFDRLQVTYKTSIPELQNGLLTMPGYTSGGEVGAPALPVRGDIIEVPFCDDIVVSVENAVYDTVQFIKSDVFYALQPSRSKSDTAFHELVFNEKIYGNDAFYGLPLADVEVMGIARDRRLAQLRFSPVQVNPVTGQVIVCRSADVTVTYRGADADRTVEHYRRYHTPAFSVGSTLNSLYSNNQSVKESSDQAIRMVIAVPSVLRCEAIERFANWKRMQGFMVDLLYCMDANISSNTQLAAHLQSLYDNATEDAPAPTFLLLIGDHNQLRAFESRLAGGWNSAVDNDHVTDLYFVTWTANDDLPDCYQGRFSATDTSTLVNIVNKTLLYEQYAFSDDSYLGRAALIAGEDNGYHTSSYDNAWVYADPTMDYIAYQYVNSVNGFSDVTYYKNDTTYAPSGVHVSGYCSSSSAPVTLRNLYNTGIGLINYSAHGDWDRWHKPSFTVSHVSNMNNLGKPSFMIGNCCLSSKFDKPICFAEALLRRPYNAGAVAYIGGTNSTYWREDLYWSVGIRSNISHTMSPTYNGNRLGSYDRLFHTHAEARKDYATTAGAMVYYGNFSVNSSTSSYSDMKKYYWEVYELMGDPSLMPWMGRAADMNVTVARTGNTLRITSLPNAYVAIVDTSSYTLLNAQYADGSGVVTVTIPDGQDVSSLHFSATLQNHKPYFRGYGDAHVGIQSALDAQLSVYPNPATDQVTIEGLPQGSTVELFDAQGRLQLTTNHGQLTTSDLPAGLYLLRIQSPTEITTRKLIISK